MFKLSNFQIKLLNTLLVVLVVFVAVKAIGSIREIKYLGTGIAPATTISFEGKGEVTAVPDIAGVNLTVREEGKTVKEAQDKVSAKVSGILKFLKENGIAERDIKTQNYNSYPKYDYGQESFPCGPYGCPPSKQILVGYEVSQNLEVKIRKIDDAGRILQGLGDLGVTEISGPNFQIDEEEGLKEEARRLAIADAKKKAALLARDLGVRLVRIVNFSEGGNYPIYGRAEFKGVAADMAAPSPIPELPPGENKIISNVTITYEIR